MTSSRFGHRQVRDDVALDPVGHVVARVWSPDVLRKHIKSWPILETDKDRLEAIHGLDAELADETVETYNLTVDGLLNHVARGLNPIGGGRATASHLALGTGTASPQATNTELTNEVHRSIVGDADRDGSDLLTSTFLSQAEANGYTLTEVGLVGGRQGSGDPLLTHALFASGEEINKTSKKAVTIDYILNIQRPA